MSDTARTGVGARHADSYAAPKRSVVVGAGTMGRGIVQLLVQAGSTVDVVDAAPEALTHARRSLEEVFTMLAGKGRLAEPPAAAMARLRFLPSLPDDDAVEWLFEAVVEDLAVKREIVLRAAEAFPSAVLATNTSTLSVTAIAAGCPRPHAVLGLHFFNPAPLMPLVEVVTGAHTDPALVDAAAGVARALGRTPVVVSDRPGFVVNRVARPFYGEALRLAGEGVPFAAIDRAAKGAGFPMGPFELLDLIGIDVNLAATTSVYQAFFQEPRYRPHPLQTHMVEAGRLGRKSGRGFYRYGDDQAGPPAQVPAPREVPEPPPATVLGRGAVARFLRRRLRLADRPAHAALLLDARIGLDDKELPPDLAALPVASLCWAHSASRAVERCGRRLAGFSLVPGATERPLVELMPPEGGDPSALGPLREVFEANGLPTLTLPDRAGGVAFRLTALLANEALSALAEGLAGAAAIDTAMRLGTRYPRGPLEWAEALGLADLHAALRGLHAETLAERFAPQPLLTRLAAVGAEGVERGPETAP